MYHDIIHKFQQNIYKLLNDDDKIKSQVDRVYLSIKQDAKYPFLLINVSQIENKAVARQNIVAIEFEICIFTNDKNHDISLKLTDQIVEKINVNSFDQQNFVLAGIKTKNIEFADSKDLISKKLTIHYQALLKQKL